MTASDPKTGAAGALRSDAVWGVALLAAFAAMTAWFGYVDFYDRHFFDHGFVVVADNAFRTLFLVLLMWLVYAPGAAAVKLLARRPPAPDLTPAERGVIAFAIGAAIWHVLMLILGVAGLYYRLIAAAICAVVLIASARHFGAVARGACGGAGRFIAALRRWDRMSDAVGTGLIVLAAAWLLPLRGLYPGGSGDYYTHYFYYYLRVIENHGLAPNDVWYHYFYSKGYGLFFLGMLLTDPEAPTLVTYAFVLVAAVGLAVLTRRMAPGSLWPGLVASLYLLFNLTGFVHGVGGGEFQKDHEHVSALIALVAVGLCLARPPDRHLWLTFVAASAVTIAIIAQPIGIIIDLCIAGFAAGAAVRGHWRKMWAYVAVGGMTAAAVLAMLGLGWLMTGLASDHALNLMLRFANIPRLDAWGVLPQLVVTAWIRDNYSVPPPWGPGLLPMLRKFLWLDEPRIPLQAGLTLALLFAAARAAVRFTRGEQTAPLPAGSPREVAATTTWRVGALIAMLAAIALPVGHAEPVSFVRASTFFFPLLLLFAAAACLWSLPGAGKLSRVLSWLFPAALLIGTVAHWRSHFHWVPEVEQATANAMRFVAGRFSLADAYEHQIGAPGGINPDALAAYRQLPAGTPIWATDTGQFCMVPGCWMESVVSFRMSSRLDEILTGTPEHAKALLQEAGLNYFLISPDVGLLDLLPYSKLFAADTIARYLGLKWTNGRAYLLTWLGPETTPLPAEFLARYTELLAAPEHPWFRFRKLVTLLPQATAALRAKPWGAPIVFSWQAPPPDGTIRIVQASYGASCAAPGAVDGNVTVSVQRDCNGLTHCNFRIDVRTLGDPASGCAKDFSAIYRCRDGGPISVATLPREANGRSVALDCPAP